MRKSRFTDEQIVTILRETDRDAVPVVAKRYGISEQTIYTWKKRFGTFQPDDVRRLRQLEQENRRLKKLVAEHDLEIEVMMEISAKNAEPVLGTPARSSGASCRPGSAPPSSRTTRPRPAGNGAKSPIRPGHGYRSWRPWPLRPETARCQENR